MLSGKRAVQGISYQTLHRLTLSVNKRKDFDLARFLVNSTLKAFACIHLSHSLLNVEVFADDLQNHNKGLQE